MIPRIRIHERHVLMWLLGVTLATMVVGALWLGLGSRHESHKLAPGGAARIRWMRPGQPSLLADYFDPSVLSLPSERGFSGAAWRHVVAVGRNEYQPDQAPAFLALPAPLPLPVLLAEPPLGLLTQVEIAPAAVIPEPGGIVTELAATNSALEITGALHGRRIVQAPILPVAEAAVRATQVLIAVTADGRVRYAVVERSSGNEQLDGAAVAAVRQVWFAPEAMADPLALTWGAAKLVWAERI